MKEKTFCIMCIENKAHSHTGYPYKGDAAMKPFKVGTFYDGKRFMAYTTWYSPEWSGCIEYTVEAVSGTEAKKSALRLRKEHEEAKHGKAKWRTE